MSENQPNWSVKVERRKNTAGVEAYYVFPVIGGKPHAYVPATGKLANRVRALSMIGTDLLRAHTLLGLAETHVDELLHDALWTSAVAAYARCFVSGDGRGLKLEKSSHLNHLPEILRVVHGQVLQMRHEFVAHAGNNNFELAMVQVALRPPPEVPGVVGVGLPSMRQHLLSKDYIQTFMRLVEAVRIKVNEMLARATGDLQAEYARKPTSQVYANAVLPRADT